jgi:DNA gyrase/topoisomerase IV subunit A
VAWATATGRLGVRAVPAGTKGKSGNVLDVSGKTRADAVVTTAAILATAETMLVFTDDGRVRGLQVHEIPELASGGVPLSQIVDGVTAAVVRVLVVAPTWDGPRTEVRDIEIDAAAGELLAEGLPPRAVVRVASRSHRSGGTRD